MAEAGSEQAPGDKARLAVVRAITTIDEDGDPAWRVLAVSTATHTLRQALAEWHELAEVPPPSAEGVGVASPLLFIAAGPLAWVRTHGRRLRREADAALVRLRMGETDLAQELTWANRPLERAGARFNADTWRALALRTLLDRDEPAGVNAIEGQIDDWWLYAFFPTTPDSEEEEQEALAGRAIEVWLAIIEGEPIVAE
jgi:hypothetical protein